VHNAHTSYTLVWKRENTPVTNFKKKPQEFKYLIEKPISIK
jgi:hypothetical protein